MNYICATIALIAIGVVLPARADEVGVDAFRDSFDLLSSDRWFTSDGWTNGDHQNCLWLAERLSIADGILHLSLADKPGKNLSYSCAEIQTRQRFGYGTYEASMKIPFASGTNSNFFSHVGAPQGSPHNEIDFEFIGKHDGALQTNYFVNGVGGHEAVVEVPDANSRFRTYAFVWEPDSIRWYIDGKMVREVREGVPTEPQKIYLSIWSTSTLSDWLGKFEYPGKPLDLEVDWLAFTPQNTVCQFPESTVCLIGDASTPLTKNP
ncbi:family 16 glycosylhydrolase [Phyllobacterium zundukense]|uniref:Beta-glucanase n=1 Tax=Phyllobacterium zundukense TaxID=1867719 RepID=A0A2N9VQR4_9HYPH|nr:family 16 glycosylhydrolase [Phyllobacterium zundukense]ATU92268.1 hypothetical protein BLM14_11955 [Phyllobacterium zundukense]PIO41832.1 hypothetical protein B5P45_22395 [Phyllobacterium zundukense]